MACKARGVKLLTRIELAWRFGATTVADAAVTVSLCQDAAVRLLSL